MELHQEPILGDAFGEALKAHMAGSFHDRHYVERSDGVLDDMPHEVYFTRDSWPMDAESIERVTGKVLDVGAGAGRASLLLDERGFEVTALDISPGAIEVCRAQGVTDTFLGTVEDLVEAGVENTYDTFLMLGNNVGLLGCREQAPKTLDTLRRLGRDGCRVVGSIGHIYKTDDPIHFSYHERNRSLGRMAGCLRLRIRYRQWAGEWFDYLFASPDELAALVEEAGWELTDVVEGDGFVYMVELTAR